MKFFSLGTARSVAVFVQIMLIYNNKSACIKHSRILMSSCITAYCKPRDQTVLIIKTLISRMRNKFSKAGEQSWVNMSMYTGITCIEDKAKKATTVTWTLCVQMGVERLAATKCMQRRHMFRHLNGSLSMYRPQNTFKTSSLFVEPNRNGF